MTSDNGVVYRMKRTGPSTDPWGTPYLRGDSDERWSPTRTNCFLPER